MEFLLLSIALFFLMLSGLGLSLLLLPGKSYASLIELFSLSFLLGSAIVSLALFILGFLLSGSPLGWAVTILCISLGFAGLWSQGWPIKRQDILPTTRTGWFLLALNVVQIAVVTWLSFLRVLGWDGLFNFESKARLAFMNGGVLPLEFFSDPSRTWMLQSYPLLLPLTESWHYLWLGRPDQELIKVLFPIFFAAALCLLQAANCRFGVRGWRAFIAPLLIFTAPLLIIGDGSASSGYADFPLAVFYLAAVIWIMEFWRRQDFMALRLAGALLAAACWLKQEGMILWLCLMVLAVARMLLNRAGWRDWWQLACTAFPAILVIAGWRAFVHLVSPAGSNQFMPVGWDTLRANLWRLPSIAQAVFNELVNWRHWGAFWLIIALVMLWLIYFAIRFKGYDQAGSALVVLLPIALYSGTYVFSIWPMFILHLESSFPRLLIHLSPVAALIVGAVIEFPSLALKSSPSGASHLRSDDSEDANHQVSRS